MKKNEQYLFLAGGSIITVLIFSIFLFINTYTAFYRYLYTDLHLYIIDRVNLFFNNLIGINLVLIVLGGISLANTYILYTLRKEPS
ncbi:MAG: hypothetical protein ACFFCZ_21950 [Promethearchaeota archaeon]